MTKTKINVASFIPNTNVLGPGNRAALWVQGCPFHCRGCIVPEWQVFQTNQLVSVDEVAQWILDSKSITGLTISGGEPLHQAKALVELIRILKNHRELDIISFTGFTLSQLINRIPMYPEVGEYLDEIDVLIDGPYVKELDDNRGLRGSSNQKIHYLTERLVHHDFEYGPRNVEFYINKQDITLAGIPPHGILDIINGVTSGFELTQEIPQEVPYER
jgi:anaerobic ribonucleoside-triphosphate reductase activating protein